MAAERTVLVVDDTASIRLLIRTNLELEGFRVEEASDGVECLERVDEIAPDLITVDVVMPQLNGFDTVQALRARESTAYVPIVMVTTQAQATDIRRGRAAGADAYVVKPFDPDQLVDTIRSLLL
ncbi:response regulator [Solicola gregarius]|uniref:Response regulator n=1 Tax=Solicola gregarius TaxID=2908642 RepID=A0AA46YKZ4_9ACTN|nr:response regulator [Solicola gregarius]UYM05997.1 response regulator [Solicola gregarius]